VHINCPGVLQFRVDIPVVGRFRALFTLLPLEPFRQRATLVAYRDKWFPAALARGLLSFIMATVDQVLLLFGAVVLTRADGCIGVGGHRSDQVQGRRTGRCALLF
jgi:hypothetical protein